MAALPDKRVVNINYREVRELYSEISPKMEDLNLRFSGAADGLPYTRIDDENLCEGWDLLLKGLILCCTGLLVEDEHLRALHRQWMTDKPDDPVEFVFDIVWS